jgi:hypothetical protein
VSPRPAWADAGGVGASRFGSALARPRYGVTRCGGHGQVGTGLTFGLAPCWVWQGGQRGLGWCKGRWPVALGRHRREEQARKKEQEGRMWGNELKEIRENRKEFVIFRF